MKVLFNHSEPFLLAHGGVQVQIEQTKTALEGQGVEVEYLRWWDAGQRGDLIHFFGPPITNHAELAHKKGMKFVVTRLLGGLGARSPWKRAVQKNIIRLAQGLLPDSMLARVGWRAWHTADANIAVTTWEAHLMRKVFQVAADRVYVVANGVSDVFFAPSGTTRSDRLVTTASIFPVKRLLETAQAALLAQTPYWVTGRPLSESDDYYREFVRLCHDHRDILRYDDMMRSQQELAALYRSARGFVLLSQWESQSLSALEAAASDCQLLLSDLPWAHATFGESAQYCPITSVSQTAEYLRKFYDRAPQMTTPQKPLRWSEAAAKLKEVYETVLGRA